MSVWRPKYPGEQLGYKLRHLDPFNAMMWTYCTLMCVLMLVEIAVGIHMCWRSWP